MNYDTFSGTKGNGSFPPGLHCLPIVHAFGTMTGRRYSKCDVLVSLAELPDLRSVPSRHLVIRDLILKPA